MEAARGGYWPASKGQSRNKITTAEDKGQYTTDNQMLSPQNQRIFETSRLRTGGVQEKPGFVKRN